MISKKYCVIFFTSFVCTLMWSHFVCAVVYVDKSRPGGDGSTWDEAYNSLEAAVTGVGHAAAEFWIAEGTYTPSSTILLGLNQNHSYYGGFAGNETSRGQRNPIKHPVTIDGRGRIQHVFYAISVVDHIVFDGLTIQGGNANGSVTSDTGQGGGILVNQLSSLVVNNCIFKNNASRGLGGAIAIANTTSVSITNSTFVSNTSLEKGGGAISLHWLGTSTKPTAVIEKCYFEKNAAAIDGGAIWSGLYPLTLKESTFIDNQSLKIAGAVKLDYDSTDVTKIERCNFLKNSVTGPIGAGGALQAYEQSVVVEDSIFAYNSTNDSGGAVGLHSGSNTTMSTTFKNCTFYGNTAGGFAGGMVVVDVPTVYLYNSIFWGNTGTNYFYGTPSNDYAGFENTKFITRYCDIETESARHHQNGSETKTGVFSLDPQFFDPDGEDNIAGTLDDNFSLAETSPCIDRADGSYASEGDMVCHPRIDHSGIPNLGIGNPSYADIGALERIEDPSTIPYLSCSSPPPTIPHPPSGPSQGMILNPIMSLLLSN